MMTAKNLHSNLISAYNHYSEKYSLTNPLFALSGDQKIVSWYNYQTREHFYYYEEYYQWINENLQYSLVIDDRALIQVFFQQRDQAICRGSMAFLPHPDLLMSYFRFDMDFDNCQNYYHNSYHINFGYRSDNVRYTLSRFPYPSEFIKFVLFLLGKSEFCHYNKKKFFTELNSFNEDYSHFFDFTLK